MLGNKRGFSLVELIVVVAIIGVLVMLASPKFLGYVEKAELARIQHDVKIMEDKMAEDSINGVKDFMDWDDNAKDLGLLVLADLLYETEGRAKNVAKSRTQYGDVASIEDVLSEVEVISDYKIMPESMSKKIKTELSGTFYTNVDGKVYYEHDKPLTRANENESLGCISADTLGYEFEPEEGRIISYSGRELHLVIPASFKVGDKCYPVRVIGRGAFMQGGYKTIKIPQSVEKIEQDAFKDNDIERIEIPHSVTDIGNNSFSGNLIGSGSGDGNLDSSNGAIIKNSNSSISSGRLTVSPSAFSNNGPSRDTNIIPIYKPTTSKDLSVSVLTSTNNKGDKVGTITDYTGNDKVLTIPGTIIVNREEIKVTKIEKGAYQGKGLISVVMPEGLEIIEDYAFAGNQLIVVNIPSTVTYVGNYAFSFNELTDGTNFKPTIKEIRILSHSESNRFNDLGRYGDIENNGVKKNKVGKTELLNYIFVSSHDNHVIDTENKDNSSNKDEHIYNLINNENFIPISSSEDLDNIRHSVMKTFAIGTKWEGSYRGGLDKKYIQVSDINMSNEVGFNPIGNSYGASFKGIYNGDIFKIINLTIDKPDSEYVGLFGYTDSAKIKNVKLEKINIAGSRYVGGLVGYSRNSKIINSCTTGSVVGNIYYTGGLLGYSSGEIINSYSIGDVSSGNSAGGLVGENSGIIENSYSIGNVSGPRHYSGGLVGMNYQGTIKNSYSVGSVGGIYNKGGLVGANVGRVTESYYDEVITGLIPSDGGTPKTTTQMKKQSTYNSWNFNTVWKISPDINNGYPSLQWQD